MLWNVNAYCKWRMVVRIQVVYGCTSTLGVSGPPWCVHQQHNCIRFCYSLWLQTKIVIVAFLQSAADMALQSGMATKPEQ